MSRRRQYLDRVFRPVEGRMEIIPQYEAATVEDVEGKIREVVESRYALIWESDTRP